MPTDPVDGAYQTFHFLNRLKLGAFGDGYVPYLGYGVSMTLFPLFIAFGGDVAASNMAAHWVVIAAAALVLWICLSIFKVEKTYALIVILCVIIALFLQGSGLIAPGNSLRLWRSALPILMALVIYPVMALPPERVSDFRFTALVGAMAGLGLYWSNDFGIPTALSLVAIWTIWLFRRRGGNPLKVACLCGWSIVVAASVFGLVGVLFLGEDFIPYLTSNYQETAEQQFWYFYPYVENSRIYSLADFVSAIYPKIGGNYLSVRVICLAVALGAGLKILVRRGSVETDRRLALVAFLILATFGGGLLAELGGHRDPGYWIGLERLVFFGSLAALFAIPYHAVLILLSDHNLIRLKYLYIAFFFLICGMFLAVSVGLFFAGRTTHVQSGSVYWPDLGGFIDGGDANLLEISEAFKSHYPRSEDDRASRYFSSYYGPVEAAAGGMHPAPTDSIIHAHGRRRSLFYEVFSASEWPVVTTSNPRNNIWSAWNRSSAWPFFRHLFLRYDLRQVSKFNLFWHPLAQGRVPIGEPVTCEIEAGDDGNALTLWLGSEDEALVVGMLYELEVKFIAGHKENVSIFDNFLRRGLIHVKYASTNNPSNVSGIIFEHGLPLVDMSTVLVVEAADQHPNPIRIASYPSAHTYVGVTSCVARSFLMSPWGSIEDRASAAVE